MKSDHHVVFLKRPAYRRVTVLRRLCEDSCVVLLESDRHVFLQVTVLLKVTDSSSFWKRTVLLESDRHVILLKRVRPTRSDRLAVLV